ncbi:MAG TPA: GNAT family protein [Anaerolineae bacterium]|nr:GNAT family protein [Anaerolineae bacterium]
MSLSSPSDAHFIDGPRLYLREVRPSDVNETYYRWMNDPEVTRYLESRFYPNSIEILQDYVAQRLGDHNNVFLAIIRKEDERHIGNIQLGPINWIHRFADVGLLIGAKDCWGQGFATEAIGMVTQYAFGKLNLQRLTAGCYANNLGSAKAFLRNGWQEEGRRKNHCFCEGRYVDVILVGITNQEFRL